MITQHNQELKLFSFPAPIHITPDTIHYFPELKKLEMSKSFQEGKKQFFRIDKFFNDCIVEHAYPEILVFPEIYVGATHQVEQIPISEAFKKLISNSLFVTNTERSRTHFEVLGALIENAKSYRLRIGRDLSGLSNIISNLITTD